MASRFHQRDSARSSLFSSYDAQNRSRPSSTGPLPRSSTPTSYAPAYPSSNAPTSYAQAYPASSSTSPALAAAYDKKGHSAAVLDSLESQNDVQVGEMGKRVAMLKDITIRIGDEIRDSTKLAEAMNNQFEGAGTRLKGTMRRMLRMAERTGVGWRVWLGFFAFVIFLFWYVWLF